MSSDLSSSPSEAPSGRWSARLSPERIKRLAECLIVGRTRAETAEALGVSPRTVTRWKKDARVLAEVERLRSRTIETRVEEVLQRLLKSDDERVVLGAVRETLRWKIQRAQEEPLSEEDPPMPIEGLRRVFVREEPYV
jgi:MoxR-like ATPase